MTQDFVPYEQALELKELGFDEPCFGSYVKLTETQNTFFMNDAVSEIDRETPLHKSLITKAPLYQQAFRWFREKYDLKSFIQPLINDDDIDIYVFAYGNGEIEHDDYDYLTYEEAELACLIKLIEIVKDEKHTHTTNR